VAERPSRVRQALGAELRALRTLAGLTQRDLDSRVAIGQVAISRIERGERLPPRELAQRWARALNAPDDTTTRLLALVDAAHGETRPWSQLADDSHLQVVAARREQDTRRVRDFSPVWLPGLCQTAEYARRLIPQVDPERSTDHAAAVAARVERQQILYREGRRFEFLIGQEALLWSPGPGAMAGQADRLATIATLTNVELRVLDAIALIRGATV
jgi:transcriptional regulator with XRE-family HTH domain